MAREYTVKINIDSAKAEQQLSAFDGKINARFEKPIKIEIKPETNTHDVEIAMAKMEAQTEKSVQRMRASYEKLGDVVKVIGKEQANSLSSSLPTATKFIQSLNGMDGAAVKAAGSIRVGGDEIQKFKVSTDAGNNSINTFTISVNKSTGEVRQLDTGLRTSSTGFTQFANAAQSAANQLKMIIGYAGAAQVLRSAFNEMKAMSDEMVTYQKVTGATAEQMKQVRASAYQSAKQYGQSPSDYLASVATMARAGYGQQSEQMANLATKTQLVGDMSAEAASKFLIAVDAGYQLKGNIEALSAVLDKANIIDNKYATSLSKIADGMTLVAPLSASMNVSVEETMAAIGTMSAVTQREGTEVARAYRMIALNIAKDTETEVEEGFKLTEENIDSLNGLLQEYAKEELEAANAAGKLLSPMKAIEAIAKAWKSGKLSQQNLFDVLNPIGGARYTNSIMALVQNWDMYEGMLEKFTTEAGSADAEVAAMMDSWSRKLEVLKTSWTEMVNNAVSEDFIKGLLDMGTGFLNWTGNLENFISVAGGAVLSIKALGAGLRSLSAGTGFGAGNALGLAVAGFIALTGAIRSFNEQAANQRQNGYQQSIEHASKTAKEAYDQAKEINDIIAEYNKLTADGVISSDELEQARSLQDRLNALVADTGESYDIVNTKIETMKGLLSDVLATQESISMEAAKQARQEAEGAIVRKANDTKSGIFGETGGLNVALGLENTDVATIVAIAKYLRENGENVATLNENRPGAFGVWQYLGGLAKGKYNLAQWSELTKTMFGGDYSASIGPASSIGSADEVVEYVKTLKDIMGVLREASKDGGALPEAYWSLKEVVDAFDPFISVLDDTRARENAITKKQYDLDKDAGSGTGTVSGADNAKEGTKAVDSYAESYNRLQAAIAAATTAQEKFNAETSTTKGDQLKFYGSALEAYNEELKAGRVNSNAFHAAAKALMGEEAYNATGGYTQNVQAAMNAVGSKGISLIDAITTLTAEYKNQKGQVVEGAGLAVLLEKLGYNVKDEKGNYAVRMTEEMYKEVMAAIPGMTREILENTANAYDQNDIHGRNTSMAPEVKEKTAEETAAEGQQEAANTQQTAADTQLEAANTMQAATGSLKEMIKAGKGADPEKGEQGEEEGSGYTPPETVPNPVSSNGETHIAVGDERVIARSVSPGVMPDGTTGSASDGIGAYYSPQYIADHKKPAGYAAGAAARDAAYAQWQAAQDAAGRPLEATAAGVPRTHWDTVQKKVSSAAGRGTTLYDEPIGPELPPSAAADAETAADQQRKVVKDIYEELDGFFAEKLENIDKNTETVYLQRAQTTQLALQRGDAAAAFGGDEELAGQYMAAVRQGDFSGAKQIVEAYLNADGVDLNPQISGELNADLDEIVVGVKPIIEQYSADEVVQALQSLTDEEREAVIKAMLETFSLEEVMTALESATEEDRVAIIKASIDTYGVDAVADELSKLSEEKRTAIIDTLVDQGEYDTAADLLAALPAEQRNAYIDTLISDGKYKEAAKILTRFTAEKRKAYIDTLVKEGKIKEASDILKNFTKEERKAYIDTLVQEGKIKEAGDLLSQFSAEERTAYIQALINEDSLGTVTDILSGLTKGQKAEIFASLDEASRIKVAAALLGLTASETKTIYVEEVTVAKVASGSYGENKTTASGTKKLDTSRNYAIYPVGTKSHPGGAALINDGTGAELYVDSTGAHIANGGKEAIVALEKGARVYTAEQTRRMLNSIPHYAAGSLSAQPNYTDGGGTSSSGRVQQLVDELNDYFDSIHTGDTSYTKTGGKSGNGKGESSGSSGGGGSTGASNGKSASDENWDSLKSLIEYILKRLGKALDEQERIIDKQIEALEAQRSRSEEQNRLEELQKAVTTAQSDLIEAESERTVRYLDDNGQWHWMADQKKVQQAKEALQKSQEELQDYLNDLVIDAQIEALNNEKDRLNEEYTGYTDLWSDILDAVATPTGGLAELLKTLTAEGTGAQKNGAAAVRDLLITALRGGSYKKNYTEALGEIKKATADNPSVPGISDAALAAMIASSGTNVSRAAMMDALQNIAGGGTLAGGAASQSTTNHQDTYYMINGVQIGSDMADLPMSEVLRRLSVFNNTLQ